jgi:hypothetical protein
LVELISTLIGVAKQIVIDKVAFSYIHKETWRHCLIDLLAWQLRVGGLPNHDSGGEEVISQKSGREGEIHGR